jgi:hypothetical protein
MRYRICGNNAADIWRISPGDTEMSFNQTAKQVTATINKVDGRALRAAVQAACIHVIGHALEFGHSPLANALDDRMTTSPMLKRCQRLVQAFLTSYGPFNYSKDTGYVFSKIKRDKIKDEGYEFEEFEANAPMWDDVERKERTATTVDAFKDLEKLVARLEKKVLAGEVISADLIPYMKALLGKYAGNKAIEQAKKLAATTPAPTPDPVDPPTEKRVGDATMCETGTVYSGLPATA